MNVTQKETKKDVLNQTDMPETGVSQPILAEKALSAEEVLLLQEMAEAGLFYGLNKSKTYPKMRQWIFTTRSGVEIINLEDSIKELNKAASFLKSISESGKKIIIVGTSPSAKFIAKEFGEKFNQPFVSERWLGGTLTNFRIIESRIKYYNKLLIDRESGALNKYTKKERGILDKKIARMKIFFEGISDMTELPGAVFILDIQNNKTAAKEARAVNIPVVALINTDTNPDLADYPIPANNRIGSGIRWVMNYFENSFKKPQIADVTSEKTTDI